MAAATLDQRLAVALQGVSTSSELAPLIDELNAETANASVELEGLRARALDPATPDGEAAKLREAVAATDFRLQRLHVACERVGDHFRKALEDEAAAERAAREAAIRAKQDAARDQFDREYPALANRIAGLCAQLVAAGLPAPPIKLGVRQLDHRTNLATYFPPPHPVLTPGDYAPGCEGDLVIKGGSK
ncbi:MAG: hypothetical protein JHD15_10860 [Phenylobacterium sp.]|uniref:hypothetical protein n=1 Tax=Phenylobacterium sp. TaxID=1871053 RepID=UPI001A2F8EA4|nr:hypothetical protein [Phenylobacterium sp.]MBJ7410843.1 hypothetical protein [Phenylobacterium sp.]